MAERNPDDYYRTPPRLAYAILARARARLPWGGGGAMRRILDTGAGDGVWGQQARLLWPDAFIVGVEKRDVGKPDGYDRWIITDWRSLEITDSDIPEFDMVIGNPPYSLAERFVRHSIANLATEGHLIYLLRLSFLASQKRGRDLWREFPLRALDVIFPRPSFTGAGTDNSEYAAFTWRRGFGRDGLVAAQAIDHLEWEGS